MCTIKESTQKIQILDLRSTITEEKSPITRFLDSTQYVILTLHMCYNFSFNKILIILDIYGMTLICINILTFIFDNLMSSTVATA